MKFKSPVLGVSIIGSVAAYILFNSKSTGLCSVYCGDAIDTYQNIFLFFPIIFLFSILTFKMPNRIIKSWWAFAKYAIPIVFVLSTFISAGFHHNPNGQWQDIFDIPALFALYGIFIVGSLVQIFRGYKKE